MFFVFADAVFDLFVCIVHAEFDVTAFDVHALAVVAFTVVASPADDDCFVSADVLQDAVVCCMFFCAVVFVFCICVCCVSVAAVVRV